MEWLSQLLGLSAEQITALTMLAFAGAVLLVAAAFFMKSRKGNGMDHTAERRTDLSAEIKGLAEKVEQASRLPVQNETRLQDFGDRVDRMEDNLEEKIDRLGRALADHAKDTATRFVSLELMLKEALDK